MSLLFITLLLLVGASLQTLLPGFAVLGSIGWPILPGIVLCISLKSSRSKVLYAGLLAAVLNDALCPVPFGLSIPFFLFISLGVYAVREEVFGDQIITYAVLGLVVGLLQTIYYVAVFSVAGLRPFGGSLLVPRLLGGLLLGTVTSPLIFMFLSVFRFKRTRTARWIDR